MRIVLAGAVQFSRACLETVIAAAGEVAGVLSPARESAAFNSDYADLAPIAKRHGIPVLRVANINEPDTVSGIRALSPDVMFVFGFSQLLRQEVLAIPPRGVIGSHPTLLPEGRGRHPLIWTLVKGLDHGGLTFFHMDEGADSGAILWQRAFPVTLDDDAGSLYGKMTGLARQAIPEFLPQLADGNAPRTPQDESRATVWPKRSEADGEIDWGAPAMTAYNLIRALTRPYPGAHSFVDGRRLTVWRARLARRGPADAVPGAVTGRTVDGILVKTGEGWLEILRCDGPGADRLRPGAVLGRKTTQCAS